MNMNAMHTAALALLMMAGSVHAGDWDFSGSVGLDTRGFLQEARFDQQDDGLHFSLALQPEWRWRSDDRRQRASIVGFVRADAKDPERSRFDLREAYWAAEGDDWDLTLGINKVFWGVTESRHLVDVINQTDLAEDIDQEEKLGQPMVNLNLQRDWGRVELYLLPHFRERTFPGRRGRLRPPLPVDGDNPVYRSSAARNHVDVAARYSHFLGDVDLGLYLFRGTSREPGFDMRSGGDSLTPVYEQMTQFGIDFQHTGEAWLWKFEGLVRSADSGSFAAMVGGFEYTFFGIRDSALDLGVLVEYLYDGRGDSAPPTPFDDDVFVGARVALNDASDSSLLVGAVVDRGSGEAFFNLEAERRLTDQLSAELRFRGFSNAGPGDALFPFQRDDYLQLNLSWYF
ncbi:MAG: hypothetical protein QNJ40_16830 [Xanthomonadales bacterium]|nr:hypothetical protein [Xanthomonadales bacterium]